MWIICKDGTAINTDLVARFRMDGSEVVADMVGLPQIITSRHISGTTIPEIIQNIISGTKIMEVQ